jgi:hypothetical protein
MNILNSKISYRSFLIPEITSRAMQHEDFIPHHIFIVWDNLNKLIFFTFTFCILRAGDLSHNAQQKETSDHRA